MTERVVEIKNDSRSSEPRQGVHSPRLPLITRAATILVALGGIALTNAACNNQEDADPATQLPRETATATLEPNPTPTPALENPSEYTVPEDIKTIEDAMREILKKGGDSGILVIYEAFTITIGGGRDPETYEPIDDTQPLMFITINNPKLPEDFYKAVDDAVDLVSIWLPPDRFHLCDANIIVGFWKPDSNASFEDVGLDPKTDSKLPGCTQDAN